MIPWRPNLIQSSGGHLHQEGSGLGRVSGEAPKVENSPAFIYSISGSEKEQKKNCLGKELLKTRSLSWRKGKENGQTQHASLTQISYCLTVSHTTHILLPCSLTVYSSKSLCAFAPKFNHSLLAQVSHSTGALIEHCITV